MKKLNQLKPGQKGKVVWVNLTKNPLPFLEEDAKVDVVANCMRNVIIKCNQRLYALDVETADSLKIALY